MMYKLSVFEFIIFFFLQTYLECPTSSYVFTNLLFILRKGDIMTPNRKFHIIYIIIC